MRLIAYLLWLAVLVVGVVALVVAISGSPAKTLIAVDLIVVGVAGLVTMTAKPNI
jgi:hypothetical protein